MYQLSLRGPQPDDHTLHAIYSLEMTVVRQTLQNVDATTTLPRTKSTES